MTLSCLLFFIYTLIKSEPREFRMCYVPVILHYFIIKDCSNSSNNVFGVKIYIFKYTLILILNLKFTYKQTLKTNKVPPFLVRFPHILCPERQVSGVCETLRCACIFVYVSICIPLYLSFCMTS